MQKPNRMQNSRQESTQAEIVAAESTTVTAVTAVTEPTTVTTAAAETEMTTTVTAASVSACNTDPPSRGSGFHPNMLTPTSPMVSTTEVVHIPAPTSESTSPMILQPVVTDWEWVPQSYPLSSTVSLPSTVSEASVSVSASTSTTTQHESGGRGRRGRRGGRGRRGRRGRRGGRRGGRRPVVRRTRRPRKRKARARRTAQQQQEARAEAEMYKKHKRQEEYARKLQLKLMDIVEDLDCQGGEQFLKDVEEDQREEGWQLDKKIDIIAVEKDPELFFWYLSTYLASLKHKKLKKKDGTPQSVLHDTIKVSCTAVNNLWKDSHRKQPFVLSSLISEMLSSKKNGRKN